MDRSIDRFIEAISEANTTSEILVRFKALVAEYGFTWASYLVLSVGGRKVLAHEGVRLAGVPDVVRAAFDPRKPIEFDPVLWSALRRFEPFHWFEEFDAVGAEMKLVLRKVREFGLVDGIVIPVISAPGDTALFGLSAPGERFDLPPKQTRALMTICYATHKRCDELYSLAQGAKNAPLSPRERELMSLVSDGASNSVIAQKLGVSMHTVDAMLRRVFRKLGVHSRVEAALRHYAQRAERVFPARGIAEKNRRK